MIICHLCLNGTYNEGWNYQENILPKYHVKMGLDVYQIVSPYMCKDGVIVRLEPQRYQNRNGVIVIRLNTKRNWAPRIYFQTYPDLLSELKSIHPDILFIHNCQFAELKTITEYAKEHKEAVIYADNHADFSNSAANWLSKNILHKIIWRHYAKKLCPYVTKFYGVLPARVEFLVSMYDLPKEKCELLVMGADDELAEKYDRAGSRSAVNRELGITDDDFLIVTGGKIDQWKKQTVYLMEAVREIENPKVKLLVFGSVIDELKDKIQSLSDGKKIFYIGWIHSEESYRYFAAAQLAAFPGRHSVFWEQAAGQGIPMICKDWKGTHHVDAGGNVKFISGENVGEIKEILEELVSNPKEYESMRKIAEEAGRKKFSYRDIARRCVKDAVK